MSGTGRSRGLRWLLPGLLLLACVLSPPDRVQAANREVIRDFAVIAVAEPSGWLTVTETITIDVRGKDVKRGIIRDIPLIWHRQDGKSFTLDMTVRKILRNGRPEMFTTSRVSNVLEIRIGNPDVLLARGDQRYTIEYAVKNPFSRFAQWDELYWNVTGNGWSWPIERASFTLLFKKDVKAQAVPFPLSSVEFYTGRYGEKGQQAEATGGTVRTTAPLRPGQGLTVVYTFAKDVLSPPVFSFHGPGLPSNQNWLPWIFPLAVLGAMLHLRRKWQSARPVAFPRFSPPEGLSPGMLRGVVTGHYDQIALGADVLHLVDKGAIELDTGGETLVFRRPKPGARRQEKLSAKEDEALASFYIRGDVVPLAYEHRIRFKRVRDILFRAWLDERPSLMRPVLPTLCALWCLTIPLHVLAGFLLPHGAAFSVATLSASAMVLFSLMALGETGRMKGVTLGAGIALVSSLAGFGALSGGTGGLAPPLMSHGSYLGGTALSTVLLVAGAWILPRRTEEGERRLAVARGLIMYLGTAERERYGDLYPPEESIGHFEALLPYALALDQARTWANRFAAYLASVGQQGYASPFTALSTIEGLCDTLGSYSVGHGGSSVSKDDDRPSGSGSGGRGFSGGGAGGGGGRGW